MQSVGVGVAELLVVEVDDEEVVVAVVGQLLFASVEPKGLQPRHPAYCEAQKAWLASGAVAQASKVLAQVSWHWAACAEQNAWFAFGAVLHWFSCVVQSVGVGKAELEDVLELPEGGTVEEAVLEAVVKGL